MNDRSTRDSGSELDLDGNTGVTRSDPPSEEQYMAPVDDDHGAFSARYADVGVLGQGGMGEVRLCLDRRTERGVAVKRIDKERRGSRARARFLREARVQAQLDHPTIVPVYDIGVDDEGFEYFTMKRAAGVTLHAILVGLQKREPAMCARYTLPVRLGIFRQVCQGIEYAHGRGIIHRDLKPENVIVGELGEVYVIDWGIAKVTRDEQASSKSAVFKTGGDSMLGTPGYLAPEQSVDAESVDARADIYALGAMLFELLTLEPLHKGDTLDALLESALRGRGDPRVSVRRPELAVAPELERACVLATKTLPEERFASVSELLAIVAGYLEGDRDLALRRTLAQQHGDAATKALAEVLASDDRDGELRSKALREAGHALALDAESRTAVEVITRLMATPPKTIPSEAAATLAQEERISEVATARFSMWGYLAFTLPLCVPLAVVRIRSWPAVAAMIVPVVIAFGVAVMRARSRVRPPVEIPLAAALAAIAATSAIGSPYMLTPTLLAAFATSTFGAVVPVMRRPLLWTALCLLTAIVPMGLQALDLLPVGFTITSPGRIVIEHRISDASPLTLQVMLVVATLAAMLAPMAVSYRAGLQLRETRAKLVVHMWHLRQLTLR